MMFLHHSSSGRTLSSCVHLISDIKGSNVAASILVSFWRHNRRRLHILQTGSGASFGRPSHSLTISFSLSPLFIYYFVTIEIV